MVPTWKSSAIDRQLNCRGVSKNNSILQSSCSYRCSESSSSGRNDTWSTFSILLSKEPSFSAVSKTNLPFCAVPSMARTLYLLALSLNVLTTRWNMSLPTTRFPA